MKRFRELKRRIGDERIADLLLWLTITGPVFVPPDVPDEPGLPLTWVKIAAVPLLGLAVAVGRRHPVVAATVPVALNLAATPEMSTGNFMIAQILLAFLLGRRTAGLRTGLLYLGAVCAVGLVSVGLFVDDPWQSWFGVVGTVLLLILLPWLAGRYARQHDELVRTGWELAQRLEREQDLIGERTRLLERSRIAGDMHDSLGHELTLIALRAAALQVNPGLDESARRAAGELRESAAGATERLREIIGVLREKSEQAPLLPPGDTVASLVERAAASGMPVALEGELGPLPPMTDRAAYRLVQEALTNAAKHAPGAAVTVRLSTDAAAEEAVVTVANAPRPTGTPRTGHPSGTLRTGHPVGAAKAGHPVGVADVAPSGAAESAAEAGKEAKAGKEERAGKEAAGTAEAPPAARQPASPAGAAARAGVTAEHEPSPAGPPPGAPSGGYGLVGLDERIRLAGGRLAAHPVDGGFEVTARLPLGEGAGTPAAATRPHAQRELAQARRRVRRSMIDAIWVPAAAAALLLGLMYAYDHYTAQREVLDQRVYGQLRIGAPQSSVAPRLPTRQAGGARRLPGAPADPRSTDACRFYRTTPDALTPVYRLCFTDGRLTHKDRVNLGN
ncbi:histidine kinase [Streptomyces pathocidini]|uniref:sensor histidine kinase n=1 Tax=Streptomyces pathocidini TaxID=1650571 RepID=UPI0033CCEB3F